LYSYANSGDATASNILVGKTALVNGELITGTMADNGAVTSSLNAGGSYTIPAGYHNGSGKITANTLASQTSATATAANILTGQTAWVNGSKITGTMANKGAVTSTLNAGGSYTIPAGYHNGSGKITVNTLASQTSATATAANILTGQTAWVNGSKITGTMTSRGAVSTTINPGGSYTIPAGYHNGSGKVTATTTTVASQLVTKTKTVNVSITQGISNNGTGSVTFDFANGLAGIITLNLEGTNNGQCYAYLTSISNQTVSFAWHRNNPPGSGTIAVTIKAVGY
ncbi:MAG: hypothetical protein ACI31M_02670, partial [Bacilli bacterium]